MRAIVFVLLMVQTVSAQPGQAPPDPYPPPPPSPYPTPPPQPMPPPGGMVPAPYNYVPVQLTADEQSLLSQGEITDGQHIGGALVAVFVGLGVGQAVQGRYGETGWIFTLGEGASMTALVIGVVQAFDDCLGTVDTSCNNSSNNGGTLIAAGLIGLVVFRVWEVVDAFGGPPKHNAKVRALKMRLGIPQPLYTRLTPFVNKTHDNNGGVAGLSLRF